MRAGRRRLFTVASALSLLLCGLCVTRWNDTAKLPNDWLIFDKQTASYRKATPAEERSIKRLPLFLVAAYAVLPVAWCYFALRRAKGSIVHRHRTTANACLTCGYYLTGNSSGVCPECGATVPKNAGAKA